MKAMYDYLIVIHSYFRWVVLLLMVGVVVRAASGWVSARQWQALDGRLGLGMMISVDLQLVVGLLLYGVWSPVARLALSDVGAAMKVAELRFWAVEHTSLMLLGVALVHVGRIAARRAANHRVRHRRLCLWISAALIALLAGIPWPFLVGIARPWVRL